jgi:hypothetical protein
LIGSALGLTSRRKQVQKPHRARPQVESLEDRAVPAVLVLGSNANLWLEAPGWQTNGRTWVDTNVESYALGSDGFDYVLTRDGNLWQELAGWPGFRVWVDGNVASFAHGSDGYDYVLGKDGNLWQELPGWQTYGRTLVDGNVQSFAIDSAGYDYVLDNNSSLWQERLGWGRTGRVWVDGNVRNFALGNDGYEYVLGYDGNLWQEQPYWYDYGRTWVDSNVKSFARGSDNYDYVLGNDLNLWRELPGWQTNGRTWVDGNVWAFTHGPDGLEYVLSRDGNLWQELPGWPGLRNWVDGSAMGVAAGVSGFALQLDAHPAAATTYIPASGTPFGPNGPSYLDVQQAGENDCWLMAAMAEIADRVPGDITSMFTYDGTTVENGSLVGVYTVRLYNNSGTAEYVTVDTELPAGGWTYAHPVGGSGAVNGSATPVLWPALLEKAYAEADGFGIVTGRINYWNAYDALGNTPDWQGNAGGLVGWAYQGLTGKPTNGGNLNPSDAVAAWNAGELVVICTPLNPPSSYIVGGHCYAMVGYNSSNSTFIIYNPLGTDSSGYQPGTNDTKYGLFWANWAFVSQNFNSKAFGYGAAPGDPAATFTGLGAGGGNGASGGIATVPPAPATLDSSTITQDEANRGGRAAGPGGASNDAALSLALARSLVPLNPADGSPTIGGGAYALETSSPAASLLLDHHTLTSGDDLGL